MRSLFVSLALILLLGACSTSGVPTNADAELDVDAQGMWNQFVNSDGKCFKHVVGVGRPTFGVCERFGNGSYWHLNRDGLLYSDQQPGGKYVCLAAEGKRHYASLRLFECGNPASYYRYIWRIDGTSLQVGGGLRRIGFSTIR